MNQVTLRAQLARAPCIRLRNSCVAERIRSDDDDVMRDDVAVLERKDIERAEELLQLENERNRQRASMPTRHVGYALDEIVEGKPIDERQRVQESRSRRGIESVRDNRSQSRAEDAVKLGGKTGECRALVSG